ELPPGTLYLSKPHLYGHDSNNTNIAFMPDAKKHESTIYFEAISGTPIKAQLRIQLNVNAFVDPSKIDEEGNLIPIPGKRGRLRLIPMFWVDQEITVNDETLHRLQRVNRILQYGQRFHDSVPISCLIIAFLLSALLISVLEFLITCFIRPKPTNTRKMNAEDPLEANLNQKLLEKNVV
ncbi:unnamed protein product, partial [Didymodactylos carnosus]